MSTLTTNELNDTLKTLDTLPEGDIKDSLMKDLAGNLTLKQVTEMLLASHEDKATFNRVKISVEILLLIYKKCGVPIDISVKDFPKEITDKLESLQPQFDLVLEPLNVIIRTLVEVK